MSGQASPPVGQPQPLAVKPAPPVSPGFSFETAKDWFLKFTNIRQFARGDHFVNVNGVRVSLAATLLSTLTLGWYHSTTIGGSLTQIKGKDFKLGLGILAYLGFSAANKTEITRGDKDGKVLGIKLTQITGNKHEWLGSNLLENSEVAKAVFTNTCIEYWNLRKELDQQLKETIDQLNVTNTTLETSMEKCTREFQKAKVEAEEANVKATTLSAKIDNLRWEASTTKLRASENFKLAADAAAEFTATGAWEGDFGSQLQLHCSFQEFAASISKLG